MGRGKQVEIGVGIGEALQCLVSQSLHRYAGSLHRLALFRRALGRPNREQVVTERSTVATTLQALEMTNGSTLAGMLEKGVEQWKGKPAEVVSGMYELALGRLPTAKERAAAIELVGDPVKKEGVEDLLWALVMLPEFQLVY